MHSKQLLESGGIHGGAAALVWGDEMAGDVPELVPIQRLAQFVYCPRLFYLEWVQGEWADNLFTDEGTIVHKRADTPSGKVPAPEDAEPFVARSVPITAPQLGVTGKIDVVEGEGGETFPVEYKRGSSAPVPGKVREPTRVQVAAQALALRENGHVVNKGYVWFAESRERIEIPIDDALEASTRDALVSLRAVAGRGELPPPLEDSPKCFGCSLSGICLPDEVRFLRHEGNEPRLLQPARDDRLPVYLQQQGARVGISNEVLQVRDTKGETIQEIRLGEVSQLNILGNISVTTPAIRRLATAQVPVGFFSYGGWYYGRVESNGHKNVELRQAQFRTADLPQVRLALARRFVSAKLANSRVLLRRNHPDAPPGVLQGLDEMRAKANEADSIESLLGYEGNGARLYFSAFPGMLKRSDEEGQAFAMDFEGRNRRPPPDPVNALLSFTYAMLTKDWTITLQAVGLDPFLGFYHQPRYGRPSLSLDMMEEFRPLIADSVVLNVINNAILGPDSFVRHGLGVAIKDAARKRLIQTYERRMDQLVTHPIFDYRISYRRVLEVQARLLGRFLLGEIPEFPSFITR